MKPAEERHGTPLDDSESDFADHLHPRTCRISDVQDQDERVYDRPYYFRVILVLDLRQGHQSRRACRAGVARKCSSALKMGRSSSLNYFCIGPDIYIYGSTVSASFRRAFLTCCGKGSSVRVTRDVRPRCTVWRLSPYQSRKGSHLAFSSSNMLLYMKRWTSSHAHLLDSCGPLAHLVDLAWREAGRPLLVLATYTQIWVSIVSHARILCGSMEASYGSRRLWFFHLDVLRLARPESTEFNAQLRPLLSVLNSPTSFPLQMLGVTFALVPLALAPLASAWGPLGEFFPSSSEPTPFHVLTI